VKIAKEVTVRIHRDELTNVNLVVVPLMSDEGRPERCRLRGYAEG
jgi:hypothetical protein